MLYAYYSQLTVCQSSCEFNMLFKNYIEKFNIRIASTMGVAHSCCIKREKRMICRKLHAKIVVSSS